MWRFIVLFICFLFPVGLRAQSPDWHGFVLDVTSKSNVINDLGKPKNTKSGDGSFVVSSSDGKDRANIEQFTYKSVDNWQKVTFSFLEDRLRAIEFWPKNKTLQAAELPEMYKADFLFVENFAKGVSLASFEGQKETTVPKVYPTRYYMVAVQPKRYIIALINNESFKAIFKDSFKKPTVNMFPGFVENVLIFSRKVEK